MGLNPDRNIYSVAPVGSAIVIGRHMALKGGLERDRAINLIAWLTIATNAKPAEIAAEIGKAQIETPKTVKMPDIPKSFGNPEPAKLPDMKPREAAPHVMGPAEVVSVNRLTPFIGKIDAEERAAIDAAVKDVGEKLSMEPIDPDKLAEAWSKVG